MRGVNGAGRSGSIDIDVYGRVLPYNSPHRPETIVCSRVLVLTVRVVGR